MAETAVVPNLALNNVTAPDAYTDSSTLDNLPAVDHLNIDVANGAVYWQLKEDTIGTGQGGTWGSEVFMAQGSRTITRSGTTGFRVRAAVPAAQLPAGTSQAQVTVEAVW